MDDLDRRQMEEWKRIGDFLNRPEAEDKHDQFRQLGSQVLQEFDDLGDYIWKTPNLIEHERAVEEEKLRTYFPTTGILREMKWLGVCGIRDGSMSPRSCLCHSRIGWLLEISSFRLAYSNRSVCGSFD